MVRSRTTVGCTWRQRGVNIISVRDLFKLRYKCLFPAAKVETSILTLWNFTRILITLLPIYCYIRTYHHIHTYIHTLPLVHAHTHAYRQTTFEDQEIANLFPVFFFCLNTFNGTIFNIQKQDFNSHNLHSFILMLYNNLMQQLTSICTSSSLFCSSSCWYDLETAFCKS